MEVVAATTTATGKATISGHPSQQHKLTTAKAAPLHIKQATPIYTKPQRRTLSSPLWWPPSLSPLFLWQSLQWKRRVINLIITNVGKGKPAPTHSGISPRPQAERSTGNEMRWKLCDVFLITCGGYIMMLLSWGWVSTKLTQPFELSREGNELLTKLI